MKKVKLSVYAKMMGISHKTAWRWYKKGLIKGEKIGSRTILINVEEPVDEFLNLPETSVYVYCRVSTSRDKENLERQICRVKAYCRGKGYQIAQAVGEVASGMNDKRPKLMNILKNQNARIIVVEHKDRLTRFGFNYISELLKLQGRKIEVVDLSANPQDDLMHDLVSIITSFCARIYGQRRGGKISGKTIDVLSSKE